MNDNIKKLEEKADMQMTRERLAAELEKCDFETFAKALNIAFTESMAANDAFFVGKLDDEAFFESVLNYLSESSFGAMSMMELVHGLANGNSQVDSHHQYVIYTPSLDEGALQSYNSLDELKQCCDLHDLAERLLEDNTYREVFFPSTANNP